MPRTASEWPPRFSGGEISFEEASGGNSAAATSSSQGASQGEEISFADAAGLPPESQDNSTASSIPGPPVRRSALSATRRFLPGGTVVPEPSDPNADLRAMRRLPGNIAESVGASLSSLGSSIDQAVADLAANSEAVLAGKQERGELRRPNLRAEASFSGISELIASDLAAQAGPGASDRAFAAEMAQGRASRETRRAMIRGAEAIPSDAGPIERAVQGGLSSAAITVPIVTAGALIPGAQVPAVVALGGMEGMQRYGELRALNVREGPAAVSSALIGSLSSLTELTPTGALAKKSPFLDKAAEFVVTDLLGENIVSAATLVEDWKLRLRDNVTIKDFQQALEETTAQTIVGAGAQLSVSGLMGMVIDKANEVAKGSKPGSALDDKKVIADLKKQADQLGEKIARAEIEIVKRESPGEEIPVQEAGVQVSKATEQLGTAIEDVPTAPLPDERTEPQGIQVDEDTGQFTLTTPEGGELLAQETGQFIQIKRSDVPEGKRGKGLGQKMVIAMAEEAERRGLTLASDVSVSKDQQRVYEALKKKGWDVKENPSTINSETGGKVSNHPRVPVYEISRSMEADEGSMFMVDTQGNVTEASELTKPNQGEILVTKLGDSFTITNVGPGINSSGAKQLLKDNQTVLKEFGKQQKLSAAPTPAQLQAADRIFQSGMSVEDIPGGQFAKGKLTGWYDEVIRTINPEALGPTAKQAAAVLASKIAESMQKDSVNHGQAMPRKAFWDRLPPKQVRQFMKDFESGRTISDPVLAKAADNIRARNAAMVEQDSKLGIEYDPIDNYLYHIFEDGDKLAAAFETKYGKQWGSPSFTKERSFDLYAQAVALGFKPKFTNPEEIMLARQHASDIAQMRVELLQDLEGFGLAVKKSKDKPDPPTDGRQYAYRKSPNGDGFWVEAKADAVLHNAFDTRSLWTMPGVRGDVFRGAMFLKNAIVPIKLALSLFHPLHVATIDNATGMVRASKSLLSGKTNPLQWAKEMFDATLYGAKGIPFYGVWDNPKVGSRLLKAYQGKIDPAALTATDLQSLQFMAEGGMIPEMSVQYRTNAGQEFLKAIRQVRAEYKGQAPVKTIEQATKAAWYFPFAMIEAMQKPMFQIWIPSLKIASYLKDVQTALKSDPSLVTDRGRRLLTFRKLAKSVDNRYGEMAYNTLFWNRTVKDLAVANTLSLGWQLGFIREYGGGAMDIGQSIVQKGALSDKAKRGLLDRPLFVSFYTIQSLLYGALLTYALAGEPPRDLLDLIFPKNGNKDAKGQPERMNTMFYAREFLAISKHIEHEGLVPGLGHLAANKASGVVGLVKQWATGTNWMDQEIRDPNSPWHQQLRDTLKATFVDLEPISVKSARESPGTAKDLALAVAGFNKAPKYITETDTEAQIVQLYRKYYTAKQTPYESALLSNDRRQLAKLFNEQKDEEYNQLLDEMVEKYELTPKEQQKLVMNIMRKGEDYNPYGTMFERLSWQQQKRLLDSMTEEEREVYLPLSNRQHLRYNYDAPVKQKPQTLKELRR